MTLAMHDFSITVSMHDEAVLKNEKKEACEWGEKINMTLEIPWTS